MLVKGIDSTFKDADVKKGYVSAYFSIFDSVDNAKEITERSSLTKTIAERGPNGKRLIKFCLDHKTDQVPGVLKELYTDHIGGFYGAQVGTHNLGQDFVKMVESEIINQQSFGYRVIKSEYDKEMKATRLKELYLYEVSALQFLACHEGTTFIDLKEMEDAVMYFEKLDRFVRTSNATDETLKSLELKLISLTEYIKAGPTTLDDVKADNTKLIIDIINKSKNGI